MKTTARVTCVTCVTYVSCVTLILMFALPAFAGAPKLHDYEAKADEVFEATLRSVQQNNWVVTFADRKTNIISFTTGTSARTWGMDCSAEIKDLGNGKVQVGVRAQKKHQMVAWGAGGSIADKLFKQIAEQLKAETPRDKSKEEK